MIMSYDDLRKGRYSKTNRIYFVTTVTHKRKPLFKDFNSARIVIQTMKALDEEGFLNSLCWVVMPDHIHWLFQLENKCTLSDVMKRLKSITARTLNLKMHSEGQVWQRSYFDRCLRKEEDLKQIARYIVANPLRAGLTKSINNYSHWDAIWL